MLADCIIFSGLGAEADLLEIRLTELDPVVDRFVIIENDHTFTNIYRGFQFWKYVERFKPWMDKIYYRGRLGWPAEYATPWLREVYLRDQVVEALVDWPDNARVMMSDCDEIPSLTGVQKALECPQTVAFDMPLYYYWLNCLTSFHATYTVMGDLLRLRNIGGQALRKLKSPTATVWSGGWHFSCLGGPVGLAEKLHSFSHTEIDIAPYNDVTYLRECMLAPRDFLGRADYAMQFVEVNASFPLAVVAEPEKYAHLIHRG